ncbi:MAG: FAD/NAD(P)-binding oxidoreductase, partial [Nitrososphaeraceae archaeon]
MGAGFGGLTTANLLQKNLSLSSVKHQISIADSKDYFIMGLVNLWILSGIRTLGDSKIALSRLENKGIRYLNGEVTSIDPVSRTVTIKGNSTLRLEYDYLV